MRIPELDRINELAKIARSGSLNDEQQQERTYLRRAYLNAVKGQIRAVLAAVPVVDPEGSDVTPAALRDAQARGMAS